MDLSTYDPILKEHYLPPIRELLNSDMKLYEYLNDGDEYIEGKYAYIPMHVGRNEGIGSRAEDGTLPTAGSQQYDNATYSSRYIYGQIRITGPVEAASRSTTGAFEKALDREISGLMRDMKHEVNRQMWATGSGILGILNAAVSNSTTVTMYTTSTTIYAQNIRAVRKNMKIDLRKVTDGTLITSGGDSATVSSVASDGTITLSAAVTTGTGTIGIYREDTRNLDPYGLGSIVSARNPDYVDTEGASSTGITDLGSNDRDSLLEWKAQSLFNSGVLRPLELELLDQAQDQVETESEAEDLVVWFTNHAMRRKFASLLLPERRFTGASGKPQGYDGGYKKDDLSYNEVPIKVDKMAPKYRIFGLCKSSLYAFKMNDWDWMDKDGAILSRESGKDAYGATLKTYRQTGSGNPNSCVIIGDLDES